MHLISAVIITRNEERIIGSCLEAVQQVADEIIIVDSFSTDRTVEISKNFGAKIFIREWPGFGPQKIFGVQMASHNYILALDADEILTDEAISEIKNLKETGLKGVYELSRLNFYFGKFLRYGMESPDYKKRLFDRREVQWNDNQIHEDLVVTDGYPVIRLKGRIKHYSYYSIEHYIEKANYYTTIAANELEKKGKKDYYVKLLVSPGFVFIKSYFLKRGFLDGMHGFITALFNARTNFLKYAKLWELVRNNKKR
jgi:glycosyltransferase involved in cell wall biosynthesis